MAKSRFIVEMIAVTAAACYAPGPSPWLRYELSGRTTLQLREAGVYAATVGGAEVVVDLNRVQSRVHVTVDNRSTAPVTVEIGPEAGQPRNAIGEVLLRELGTQGAGGPDIMPYSSLQQLRVENGWRATFFIDEPLGRPPQLGQFVVMAIVVRDAAGGSQRVSLPLLAVNQTPAAGGRS